MNQTKRILIVVLICIVIVGIIVSCFLNQNWTILFKSELDQFFGKGNWECISEEKKESMMYTKTIRKR